MVNGSYNSFLRQVGYCKLQGYDTISKSTSVGPSIFMDGRVMFGVGMSDVQFQGRTSSCGRCMNVTRIENFFKFNDDLTGWNYSEPIQTPFTAFVMDQCKDAICTSKFLDFDIYNLGQPVAHGNPWNIEWEYIPCPVDNDPMELLLCLGPDSCNVQDKERRTVEKLLEDGRQYSYWYCHVRNQRVPVTEVHVSFGDNNSTVKYPLKDDVGWRWTDFDNRDELLNDKWTFTFRSGEGVERDFTLDWEKYKSSPTTYGYRGGIIIRMDIQV